jgi:hypothetical protein
MDFAHAVLSMDTAAGTPAPKASPIAAPAARGGRKPRLAPFALREKLAERSPAGAAFARYFGRFAAVARRGERRQEAGGLTGGRPGQKLMGANLEKEGLRALDWPFAFG